MLPEDWGRKMMGKRIAGVVRCRFVTGQMKSASASD